MDDNALHQFHFTWGQIESIHLVLRQLGRLAEWEDNPLADAVEDQIVNHKDNE